MSCPSSHSSLVSCGLPTQTELFPSRPGHLTDHSLPGTGSHVSRLYVGAYSAQSGVAANSSFLFKCLFILYVLHVGVRRQLARMGSLPLCGAQESNLGPQVELHVP